MLLTEKKAKAKWCPMVRCGDSDGCYPENRHVPILKDDNSEDKSGVADLIWNKCIGSRCMMWEPYGMADGEETGYCGLTVQKR